MNRRAYFDTGVIAKWYVPEPDSERAVALRLRFSAPAPLTGLHQVELASAWHAKVFRKELDLLRAEAALAAVQADLAAGHWDFPNHDLKAVMSRADTLARSYGAAFGARALDTLHVAQALVLGEATFVTGDVRQSKLAEAVGLQVVALAVTRTR